MSKNYIILIIIAVVLGGGLLYMGSYSKPQVSPVEETPKVEEILPTEVVVTKSESTTAAMEKKVKEFSLTAANFSFSQKEIKVKMGDTVKIVLANSEGFHDWVIDEFTARTKQISAGATDSVEFVAAKKGTFEYYCSVGNHRKQGMVGKLIVE